MQSPTTWSELAASIRGKLQILDENSRLTSVTHFNAANRPKPSSSGSAGSQHAEAILLPHNAQDVSKGVQFASKYNLSLSVKSGGYNPSNWSNAGQLIIDLSTLNEIHVGLPDGKDSSGGLERKGKGKRKAEGSPYESSTTSFPDGMSFDHRPSEPSSFAGTSSTMLVDGPEGTEGKLEDGNDDGMQEEDGGRSTAFPSPDLRSGSETSGRSGSTSRSGSGSGSGSDTTTPKTSVRTNSEKSAGKRRMLEKDDRRTESPSNSSTSAPSSNSGEAEIDKHDGNGGRRNDFRDRSDSVNNQESDNNPSATDSSGASRFILANSYPPLNLANADLSHTEDLAGQARHASKDSVVPPDSAYPFNYDAISRQAIFPDAAPPGTIPFPSLSSSSHTAGSSSSSTPSYRLSSNGRHSGNYNDDRFMSGQRSHSNASNADRENFHRNEQARSQSFGIPHIDKPIIVTFGSGVRAKQLDETTAKSGYFVPQACYPVGAAIFTTGGYGFVSRALGLSVDITTEMEVVLPKDGRIVHLRNYKNDPNMSEEEKKEQDELWWAFRGAGTAFGIVTNIKAKAWEIGQVLAGNIIFPFNPVTAPSLIKHWRDVTKSSPKELYTNITLTAGPTAKGNVIVVQFSWCGPKQSEGESILQAILAWDGERCLMKDVEIRPYADQQENVAQILSSKADTRWLVRSTLLASLTDEAIHSTVEKFRKVPAGSSWLFENAAAAIAEPPEPTCFPISHRQSPIQTAALHQWTSDKDDDKNKVAAEDWVYDTFGKDANGPFPCFLASGEGRERMIQVYGEENWEKLRELKRKYDPDGLLRFTHFEDELLK